MNKIFEEKLSIHFPPEFYKEEVRCEYRITEKAKRIMAVELDLLYQMNCVCKKLGIKYFVYCGTLLGAVRHQGFIPWDDDVDVAMSREDFNKFVKEAPPLFKNPYFLQTALTDKRFFFGYARLRNSLTTGLILSQATSDYNNGIYIDIFVLDGYIEDTKSLSKYLKMRSKLTSLINIYKLNGLEHNNRLKIIAKKALHYTVCKLLPFRVVYVMYNNSLAKYEKATERISLMTHPSNIFKTYWCTKDEVSDIVYLPFEGFTVPAPAKYREILKHMYGDYMQFPPVEKRGVWHEGILELDPDIPYKQYIKRHNK